MQIFLCCHPGCLAGPFQAWVPECPRCGSRGSLVPAAPAVNGQPFGSPGYRAEPRRRPGQANLRDLLARHRAVHRVTWGYEALPLPKTARILLYGPPGGGKSTAAAVIALSLASQGLPILILAVEEGLGESLVERFARCAGLLQLVEIPVNVTITDVETLAEAQEDLESWRARTGGGVVVIDSATELRASADWLRQVLCDDRLGTVIIAHQTTQGAPRGGWTCAYQVEVVVHVEALRARSTKSRWCPLGEWSVLSPAPITHAHPAERGAVIPFTREVRDGRSI